MLRLFGKFLILAWLAQIGAAALLGFLGPMLAQAARLFPASPVIFTASAALLSGTGPLPWQFLLGVPLQASLLAAALTALILTAYCAMPLRRLGCALEAIAGGNLTARLNAGNAPQQAVLGELVPGFDYMAGRVEALVEGKSRLQRDVSQQLLHPLARLKLGVGLGRQTPEKAQLALERIEREAYRIERLVANLNTLSQIELGVYCCSDGRIDVRQTLADLIADLRPDEFAHMPSVQLFAADNASIPGNADLICRALENVLRNGARRARTAVRVQLCVSQSSVQVLVSDDGPPVCASELPTVFEPFAAAGANRDPEGHGLELVLAHRVVTAHSGTMRALPHTGLAIELALPRERLN